MDQQPLLGMGHPAQWESYVKRAAQSGQPRSLILQEMLKANWAQLAACEFIDRIVSRERLTAIGMLVGFAAVLAGGAIGAVMLFELDDEGGAVGLCIGLGIIGIAGFFHGLGRMIRVSRTALSAYR